MRRISASVSFQDRVPDFNEVAQIIERAAQHGNGLSLTETARVMTASGHFDRVPNHTTILRIQNTAIRKLRAGLES